MMTPRRRNLAFHEFQGDLVAGAAKDSFAPSENDRTDQQQKTVDKIGLEQLRIER